MKLCMTFFEEFHLVKKALHTSDLKFLIDPHVIKITTTL